MVAADVADDIKRAVQSVARSPQYVHAPCKSGDLRCGLFSMTAFIRLSTLTFDLLTMGLVCVVTRGKDNLPADFGVCATFLCLLRTNTRRTGDMTL